MQYYLSAAHKSSGKTTISVGLAAALAKTNIVQTFKKGPDYIDTNWLQQATKRPCFNLDFFMMSHEDIKQSFEQNPGEIKLIEGNKGLFDGLSLDGSDSNAALANLLNVPVILVIDCVGITRGVAPLLLAYQEFKFPKVNIAGVIFNKVGGPRHESKLIATTEKYTDYKIIGAVPKDNKVKISERHLGLVPSNEQKQVKQLIDNMQKLVLDNVDINFFKPSKIRHYQNTISQHKLYKLTIAVAIDEAFGFYYARDLQIIKNLCTQVVYFSPLKDQQLPKNIDGLFLGGGFPETHAQQLSNNQTLLQDLANNIESGLPVYAECGGMMMLARSISYQNKIYPMADVIKADCLMTQKPQGRGYMKLLPLANHPWGLPKTEINCHEFHFSKLDNWTGNKDFVYQVSRGSGIENNFDGISQNNLVANYAHLLHSEQNPWINYFLDFCQKC